MENNETLQKRVEAIQQSNTEIQASIDEQDALREIKYRIKNNEIRQEQNKDKHKQQKNSSWGRLAYAMPIVAVITVSTLMLKENISVSPDHGFRGDSYQSNGVVVTEDGVRFKGLQPHINIYQKTEAGAKLIESNASLQAGDSLQLSYVAARQEFRAILSIDGNGVVTQHFPLDTHASVKLKASGELMLDRSYQLDDAPKFEHFFFITSKSTFDLQKVIEHVQIITASTQENTASITGLPEGLNQFMMTIKKAKQ